MPSPSNETNAKLVLDTYSHFEGRPGHALRSNNLIAVAARRNISMTDLQSGIDFATHEGWIEEGPNGSLRLTRRGFEQMRAS